MSVNHEAALYFISDLGPFCCSIYVVMISSSELTKLSDTVELAATGSTSSLPSSPIKREFELDQSISSTTLLSSSALSSFKRQFFLRQARLASLSTESLVFTSWNRLNSGISERSLISMLCCISMNSMFRLVSASGATIAFHARLGKSLKENCSGNKKTSEWKRRVVADEIWLPELEPLVLARLKSILRRIKYRAGCATQPCSQDENSEPNFAAASAESPIKMWTRSASTSFHGKHTKVRFPTHQNSPTRSMTTSSREIANDDEDESIQCCSKNIPELKRSAMTTKKAEKVAARSLSCD